MSKVNCVTKERAVPFFSIGVTTFNRPVLLLQTLASICRQTFTDFEVIVGNDYTVQPISAQCLGLDDARIRMVNHPQNMGEIRNMNTLLSLARGRYFTWLSDDDLYDPHFLAKVHAAILSFEQPDCVFTSFDYIGEATASEGQPDKSAVGQLLSGREFLRLYWSGQLKAMGCTGVFNKAYLRQIGGVEYMADTSFALFSEHLLLLRACLSDRIAYLDEPLVRYRIHEASWGCTTKDLALNCQAGIRLLDKSLTILADPKLRQDFRKNIAAVLSFVVAEFFSKIRAQNCCLSRFKAIPHLFQLRRQLEPLKGSPLYRDALVSWISTGARLIWCVCTQFNLKAMIRTG